MQKFWLCATLFLFLGSITPMASLAATCNEECNTPSDCDSSCPICIGSCVSCFEIQTQNACTDTGLGGDVNCQWDGQKCKPLSDVPSMPRGWWISLLIPFALAAAWTVKRHRAKSAK